MGAASLSHNYRPWLLCFSTHKDLIKTRKPFYHVLEFTQRPCAAQTLAPSPEAAHWPCSTTPSANTLRQHLVIDYGGISHFILRENQAVHLPHMLESRAGKTAMCSPWPTWLLSSSKLRHGGLGHAQPGEIPANADAGIMANESPLEQ